MARLALTAVGFMVGTALGNPMLGAFAGSVLGGFIEGGPETPTDNQGVNQLENAKIQNAKYGVPIYRTWGTLRIAGNIIWMSDITETIEGSGASQTNTLTVSIAIGICDGPIDQILRIWGNRELVYDTRSANEDIVHNENINLTIYNGTETQVASSIIESHEGAGNVPAHRGMCYVVFEDLPLAAFQNRIPNFEFEVADSVIDETPYVSLDGVIASATDRDNIVFHPDEIHFTVESDGTWQKVNTLTNSVVLVRYQPSPKIPVSSVGFDIDENNIIHSIKTSGATGVFCQLDGDTYELIDSDSFESGWTVFERIRVFKSSVHPHVVLLAQPGALLFTHRYNYTYLPSGSYDRQSIAPPANTLFSAIDLDNANGIVWAVCKSDDGTPRSRVVRITLFDSGGYTQQIWDISANIDDADEILYDADTDTILVASSTDDKIIFFDAADMTFDSGNVISEVGLINDVKSAFLRGVQNGFLYFSATTPVIFTVYQIDMAARAVSNQWTIDDSGLCTDSTDYSGSCYCKLTHAMIIACPNSSGSDYIKLWLNRGSETTVPLSSIVEDICADAGLDDPGEIDASELTDEVRGFAVTQQKTARAILESLMSAYFFDVVDSGGQLKFVKRGGESVFALTEDDLAAHIYGEGRPQLLVSNRQQESELPASVDVMYIDYDSDQAVGVQSEKRLITQSQEQVTIQLSLVLDNDEAKQICIRHLGNAWTQRMRYSVITHREFTYLDPADVGTITKGGVTYTVRIEEIEYRGGLIVLHLVAEDTAVYDTDAPGVDDPIGKKGGGGEVHFPSSTLMRLIDCPLIRATENYPGIQVATLGYTDQWTGTNVYKSDSDIWPPGPPWMATSKDAVMGKSTAILDDVTDPWIWDEGGSINVLMIDPNDTLSSAIKADVLDGTNMALLGDEVVQWRTATLESNGSYTLTGLLRGRKGTEWATGIHAVGEYFIPLYATNIQFMQISVDEVSTTKWYRPVSFGMNWDSGISQSFEFAANNMKPLSPQHVAGTRDGSNNLTITWTRRTRMNGEWIDGGDVALGETTMAFDVDIYDGDSVVRTIEVTSESATYTSAEQVSDGLTPGDPVDIIVYQISSVIDRGFGTSATL